MVQGPPTEFQIGVHVRVQNHALDQAVRAKGWTRAEFAKHLGIPTPTVYSYLNFRGFPSLVRRTQISVLLEVHEDILFPEELSGTRLKKQPDAIVIGAAEARTMIGEEGAQPNTLGLPEVVSKALKTLPDRYRFVMRHLYGLEGESEKTGKQVGALLGVSAGRVWEIKGSALKALRHRSMIRKFVDYCGAPSSEGYERRKKKEQREEEEEAEKERRSQWLTRNGYLGSPPYSRFSKAWKDYLRFASNKR